MIIKTYEELESRYDTLQKGDIVAMSLSYEHIKTPMIVDLLERSVLFIPSVLCQLLSRYKSAQANILKKWMLPHTFVIQKRQQLLQAIQFYSSNGIKKVVTKEDHIHCGQGVKFWNDLELVYNVLADTNNSHELSANNRYPFVIQPFLENIVDLRVIIVSDYVEAYIRKNETSFRHNMACGGHVTPYKLEPNLINFCLDIMQRGQFPYAHIDIHITQDNNHYLSEINLNGGAKGATIASDELKSIKQKLIEKLAVASSKNI